jgi:hypothetical protein
MTNAQLIIEFAPRSISSILSMAGAMKLRRTRDWKVICANYKPTILRWSGST